MSGVDERRGYSRGYSKGYYAGAKSRQREVDRAHEGMERALARADRAEAVADIGHCVDCQFWRRGGDACVWGFCTPPEPKGLTAPWINAETVDYRERTACRLSTRENFGCVLFADRALASDGAAS